MQERTRGYTRYNDTATIMQDSTDAQTPEIKQESNNDITSTFTFIKNFGIGAGVGIDFLTVNQIPSRNLGIYCRW